MPFNETLHKSILLMYLYFAYGKTNSVYINSQTLSNKKNIILNSHMSVMILTRKCCVLSKERSTTEREISVCHPFTRLGSDQEIEGQTNFY
jgi:hypothetical protein